jgi:hypothetical protein
MRATLRPSRLAVHVALALALALCLVSACGGDDDDTSAAIATDTRGAIAGQPSTAKAAVDSNTPASVATATVAAPRATATATTATTAATATTEPAADATATTAPAEEPTEAATETPSDTAGADLCETPEMDMLDADTIPNFSADYSGDVSNFGDSGESSFIMTMRQTATDTYYYKVESTDETGTTSFEVWRVADEMWVGQDGETIAMPADAAMPGPSDIFAQYGQSTAELYDARVAGRERVSGRETTKYIVDGEEWVDAYNACSEEGEQLSNGSGSFSVWIDDEWEIAIKTEADLSFTNADGTPGSFTYITLLHDFGSTDPITPPQ